MRGATYVRSLARPSLLALRRAALQALVVPGRNLVHVHAHDSLARLGARVYPGDAAHGDAGLRRGILRQASEPPEEPVRGANALAHERGVRAIVVTPSGRPRAALLSLAGHAADQNDGRDYPCRHGPRTRNAHGR